MFINADYLRLQNVKINGNVTVSDDAYYNLTFDNVTVKQSVVIEDGYSNSFTFAANNSTIPQLYVKRDNTLVNTDQKITAIVIEGDADDVALNTKVGKVTIAAGMYPTITGYATIDELIVERGADADLRVNGTLAKLNVIHGDSTIYSNRNLLIADMLIPRGSDYKDIIRNYSIIDGYIMSVKYSDATNNLLGIGKVPNIPNGVLHPGDGGADSSNTAIKFDQAVARAVASFSAVPNGKSVTLIARFNSLNNIVKTALGEAQYDYRIRSTTPLTETAKYTLEIKNGTNTYTATVTGKQLNDGIKLEYLILKALGQATNMSGFTSTWTISVKTLNGDLDLRAELLIKDTVAKTAVFTLKGTDADSGEDGGDGTDDQTAATAAEVKSLTDEVAAAKKVQGGATEGTSLGQYATGSKVTFQTAIDVADKVAKTTGVTKSAVEKAKAELAKVKAKFEEGKVTTLKSTIGRYEAGTSAQSIGLGTHFSIENGIVKFG